MRKVVMVAVAAALLPTSVMAEGALDIPGLIGTIYALHERQQTEGTLIGCAVNFSVIFRDYAYKQGKAAGAIGSVTFYVSDPKKPFLALKVGLNEIGTANKTAEPPAFAYLQTKNASTATSMILAGESPDFKGYRLWMAPISNEVADVITGMLIDGEVTLGMNRTKGGKDLLVPLDLSVVDTSMGSNGSFQRKQSGETLAEFNRCFKEAAGKIGK